MEPLSDLQRLILLSLFRDGVSLNAVEELYNSWRSSEGEGAKRKRSILTKNESGSNGTESSPVHSTTVGNFAFVSDSSEERAEQITKTELYLCDDLEISNSSNTGEGQNIDGSGCNEAVSSTSECLQTEGYQFDDDCEEELMVHKLLSLDPWESSNLIRAFMNRHNVPQKEAVEKTGLNQSHLSQHLNKGTPMKEHKRVILYRWFVKVRMEVAKQYRAGMKRSRQLSEVICEDKGSHCRKQCKNRFKWGKVSLGILNDAFKFQPNPLKEARCSLAVKCNQAELKSRGLPEDHYGALAANFVTEMRVYNWFANRRKEDSFRVRIRKSQQESQNKPMESLSNLDSSSDNALMNTSTQISSRQKKSKSQHQNDAAVSQTQGVVVNGSSGCKLPVGMPVSDPKEGDVIRGISVFPLPHMQINDSLAFSQPTSSPDAFDDPKTGSTMSLSNPFSSHTTVDSSRTASAAELVKPPKYTSSTGDEAQRHEDRLAASDTTGFPRPVLVFGSSKPPPLIQPPKTTPSSLPEIIFSNVTSNMPYVHVAHLPSPIGQDLSVAYPGIFPGPLQSCVLAPFSAGHGLVGKVNNGFHFPSLAPTTGVGSMFPFVTLPRFPFSEFVPLSAEGTSSAEPIETGAFTVNSVVESNDKEASDSLPSSLVGHAITHSGKSTRDNRDVNAGSLTLTGPLLIPSHQTDFPSYLKSLPVTSRGSCTAAESGSVGSHTQANKESRVDDSTPSRTELGLSNSINMEGLCQVHLATSPPVNEISNLRKTVESI